MPPRGHDDRREDEFSRGGSHDKRHKKAKKRSRSRSWSKDRSEKKKKKHVEKHVEHVEKDDHGGDHDRDGPLQNNNPYLFNENEVENLDIEGSVHDGLENNGDQSPSEIEKI